MKKTSIETYFLWYYSCSTVLSGNIGQELELELEPEPKPKIGPKVEPESKINNFGSATLIKTFPPICAELCIPPSTSGNLR